MENTTTEGPRKSEEGSWAYHQEENPPTANDVSSDTGISTITVNPIEWTASEYIDHSKDASWYMLASLGSFALAIIVYFATGKSIGSAVVVIIAGGLFVAAAARPPRTLKYSLDATGLTISGKLYTYDKFKSFSVVNEGAFNSVALQPLERFMPSISIYYAPEDEDKIADLLSEFLPYEERELAQVDKLMRKIRF